MGHQRALRRQLPKQGKQFSVVLLAALEEVDHELDELLVVLGMAVPLTLGVAGGTGYFLARKALGPVRHLHRMTEEITADRLDRRLPVTNPGDELGSLTETINGMIARLERSFAEIRRFTADASHELRTPLAVIRTEAEVALRRSMTLPEYQQLLGSILEECERLTRLTDQLLTLSREDAGATHLLSEKVDLAALVRAVAESMRPLAVAKGIHLQVSGNGETNVRGDTGRLRQVFYNLLDNAIKYTPEGATIEVWSEARDRNALVRVRDTGIGIPAEHLPHVFERFYRVDKARSREQGGTGLGLSIAKTIVNAHG
jgi:heavy metal sensor kinase